MAPHASRTTRVVGPACWLAVHLVAANGADQQELSHASSGSTLASSAGPNGIASALMRRQAMPPPPPKAPLPPPATAAAAVPVEQLSVDARGEASGLVQGKVFVAAAEDSAVLLPEQIETAPDLADDDVFIHRGVAAAPPAASGRSSLVEAGSESDLGAFTYRGVGPHLSFAAATSAGSFLEEGNTTPNNSSGHSGNETKASRLDKSTVAAAMESNTTRALRENAETVAAAEAAAGAAAAMGGFALVRTPHQDGLKDAPLALLDDAAGKGHPEPAISVGIDAQSSAAAAAASVRRRRGRSGDPEESNESFAFEMPVPVDDTDVFQKAGANGAVAHARSPGGVLQLGGQVATADSKPGGVLQLGGQVSEQAAAKQRLNHTAATLTNQTHARALSRSDVFKYTMEADLENSGETAKKQRQQMPSAAKKKAAKANETQAWTDALTAARSAVSSHEVARAHQVDDLFTPSSSQEAIIQENTEKMENQKPHRHPPDHKPSAK